MLELFDKGRLAFIVPITWGKSLFRGSINLHKQVFRKCLKHILPHWMFNVFYTSELVESQVNLKVARDLFINFARFVYYAF